VRNQGRFLLVLEARRGSSNRLPGTNLYPSDPAQRPSLQILSERDLGENPTTTVCDTGPPPDGGGVPGVTPPDFRPGQDVTDALTDMSCRFTVQTSPSSACTRRFGDFEFLGGGTERQYCFQVPLTVVFPDGKTTVAAQVLDTSGNVGPRKEIVIEVK
jgi:hypothetical protein